MGACLIARDSEITQPPQVGSEADSDQQSAQRHHRCKDDESRATGPLNTLKLSEHELMVRRINLGLSDADVRHGYGGTTVVQHLTNQLNAFAVAVHQPATSLTH